MTDADAIILKAKTLRFRADPFASDPGEAVEIASGQAVLIENGLIAAIGDAAEIVAAAPTTRVVECGDRILGAAFVDCHNHFAQTRIIASWGKRLIDWLEGYTFPEEMRFGDAGYAATVAEDYLDLLTAPLSHVDAPMAIRGGAL